ncbi:MAG: ubiquinone/menaquinone biosynthesis methyltransferase [Candidatus Binatia bacterium]
MAVRTMFDRIAPHYDRMNAIVSWRLDRGWRRTAIAAAALCPGDVAVDLACGTGNFLTLAAATGARAVGVDFAAGMLAAARHRDRGFRLVRADATALPLADGVADAITCGFALRNFVALPPVFAEAARVLKPGGRIVLLEVGTPESPLARVGHHLWFRRAVPLLGALLADRAAYAYLPASVAYLPPTPTLLAMLDTAGFVGAAARPLLLGAAQLVTARRRTA